MIYTNLTAQWKAKWSDVALVKLNIVQYELEGINNILGQI